MYPLDRQYVDSIINFIRKLRNYNNIVVETNGMSTQIFGNYDHIMNAINTEMKSVFLNDQKVVFNLKIINSHLQEKPTF
jgi:uncharacterized protein YqgV (UPF0045/DUF77 family)